jgi:hypothetical protein
VTAAHIVAEVHATAGDDELPAGVRSLVARWNLDGLLPLSATSRSVSAAYGRGTGGVR